MVRWCPDASGRSGAAGLGGAARIVSLDESQSYCRRLARTHYENFPLASWLLPRRLHQHFYNIYAFCRWADDLADEVDESERSLQLLLWWRSQLGDCYHGKTNHPVFVALKTTIDEFEIPPAPFEDLITAFEQDQRVTQYETFDELLGYCRCSANPVGRLVLYICRQHSEQTVGFSDTVCTGLQLANFWQDMGRDMDKGRTYIPHEDCDRFGYHRDELRNRVTNNAFVELMKFQVERTQGYLDAVFALVDALPGRLQVDIELFARGGMKILDRIESIQYRVWDLRPVVTKWDFASLLLRCIGRLLLRKCGIVRARQATQVEAATRSKAIP